MVCALHTEPDVNPWIAIVGAREHGRLELTYRVRAELERRGTRVTGFVQVPCVGEDQSVTGYDLVDLASRERVPLARDSDRPLICNWGFDDRAFERAREWALRPADVSVMEVGRLEAAERGHWPAVLSALRDPRERLILLGLRPNVVASVAVRLPDPVELIELPAGPGQIDAFVGRVNSLTARCVAVPT